ncbi:hypothetical protein [Merdimonas faecis]|uniref:hypothetical protein n=1 Tax=Merdimonas faecis TaxID=1653435 RepID=UPI0023FA47B4|nr:hypothetical protein [Merdimonas faecis]
MRTTSNYQSWVHRFGIVSSLILLIAMTAFPIAASAIYGLWPDLGQLWPGFIAVILFMAPFWPAETIGYMSVMGPGALYMSYITGNVTNLRMPATVGTINSLGIKPNTDECHTLAIIACGASVITTVAVIAIGVVVAAPLEPVLNLPAIQPAFNYVVPALFGGLVAQTILKGKKQFLLYLIPLAVCLFFCYFTSVNSAYYMLIAIAISGAVHVLDYRRGKEKEAKEGN